MGETVIVDAIELANQRERQALAEKVALEILRPVSEHVMPPDPKAVQRRQEWLARLAEELQGIGTFSRHDRLRAAAAEAI